MKPIRTYVTGHSGGFSALELMIGLVISAMVVIVLSVGFRSAVTTDTFVKDRSEADVELSSALAHLLKVGRFAHTCTIRDSGGNLLTGEIQCWVDMNPIPTPSSSDDTEVRFRRNAATNALLYEVKVGLAWTTRATYRNIATFNLCDDQLMQNNACTVGNAEISTWRRRNLDAADALLGEFGASLPGTFFRFSLGSRVRNPDSSAGNGTPIQGAFFLRNANPPNGIIYRWGK